MKDWTVNPHTGRSNSSDLFLKLEKEIERLIRDDAYMLITGRADRTAGLILAQLAHRHGLIPLSEIVEAETEIAIDDPTDNGNGAQ